MQMEAETVSMLIGGFSLVISIGLLVIAGLLFKYKKGSLLWFLPQIGFLVLAFVKFVVLIQSKPQMPDIMLSEENSLSIGLIGIYWAASMVFMYVGVLSLVRKQSN